MITRKINTRFMEGNIDIEGVIYDIVINAIGMSEAMSLGIDFDSAIYSNGFISAINNGLIPDFSTIKSSNAHSNANGNTEYHHIIIEDECFVVYFN